MTPALDAILVEPPLPVPFDQAWAWQRQLQARLLSDPDGPEALLLLQHPPCYTLGRGASEGFLRFDPADPPAPLFRIDRGGEVTHHLPGQLVAYPVLALQRHGGDLHLYLRDLEGAVLEVLAALGLRGERQKGLTGVWLEGRKVAAIGVGVRRWISQHGLALNVTCPLEGFSAIVPCGLTGHGVTRLSDWCPGLTTATVQILLRQSLARRFGLVLRPPKPTELPWR
ncbi:lipoyl(octanoyl) transferase LipB [Synechococcus sp. Cruz-9H2]|uniref:lipoyl(octanoyl) transferase LipB n=1 Tax=unclassified Synechococcus TaxID=2626047 RepID=UPI0020CEE2D3|nr:MULTISPECIES: lipoyl(octanoyl) transferase LipB [unclassified Synechococcus]MCP9819185.1 lipoyl(octanoyl) transferase LipB [Synechococcus sp. Cruz-9H2]MCP9843689.1 lipoyl(octanoyl) transferase LipB [Synechococcus sp. Edmonson 11F2]MCP9855592.1 lipoyl(octanoyl) transferase LipB [Synechococcus sp. Cruz-9C9]MCP9863030.1 lipoyl(octanoyl) transferase LipB [Synechococcus sp. Cruz-7E5]MCP9870095.1 lipoyl(octanoyl) transferase LipB [Synechococcus sp. Cruz-7B9]